MTRLEELEARLRLLEARDAAATQAIDTLLDKLQRAEAMVVARMERTPRTRAFLADLLELLRT